MYEVAALIIILFLLGVESRSCIRRKVISGFLLFLVFHFLFLHLWLVERLLTAAAEEIDPRVSFLVFLFDVALLIGWSFGYFVLPPQKRHDVDSAIEPRLSLGVAYWGMFASCLCVAAYYLYTSGIPLLSEYVDESRHAATKGHGYIRVFVVRGLPLSAAGLMVIYLLKARKDGAYRWLNGLLGAIPVAACFAVLMATGFRAPLLYFLLLLVLIYSDYSKRFSVAGLALAGTALMLLFAAITLFKYRFQVTASESSGLLLLGYLRHRVILDLPRVIGYAVNLVDAQGLWLGKSYCMDIASALPGPGVGFGEYLLIFTNPSHPFAGVVALTPSLIGETFVDFGYVGVAIIGLCLPMVCYHLENWGHGLGINGYVFRNVFRLFLANSVGLGLGTLLAGRVIPTGLFMLSLMLIDAVLANAVKQEKDQAE